MYLSIHLHPINNSISLVGFGGPLFSQMSAVGCHFAAILFDRIAAKRTVDEQNLQARLVELDRMDKILPITLYMLKRYITTTLQDQERDNTELGIKINNNNNNDNKDNDNNYDNNGSNHNQKETSNPVQNSLSDLN